MIYLLVLIAWWIIVDGRAATARWKQQQRARAAEYERELAWRKVLMDAARARSDAALAAGRKAKAELDELERQIDAWKAR
jgi:hypothetical protein